MLHGQGRYLFGPHPCPVGNAVSRAPHVGFSVCNRPNLSLLSHAVCYIILLHRQILMGSQG